MADNTGREYKADEREISTGTTNRTLRSTERDLLIAQRDLLATIRGIRSHTRVRSRPQRVTRVRPLRQTPTTPEDYVALKTAFTTAVQAMNVQHEQTRAMIRDQHQQTREEVHATRGDILRAIRSSPAECLKLISEFGSLFLIFALAIRFALGIELVNPAFAGFMLFAFLLYWGMAQLKQRIEKRDADRSA